MRSGETDEPEPPDSLRLEFLGETYLLAPGDDLRFGRSADLVIDENPFMHRVVGRFVHREGVWWLQNHGTKTRLQLLDGTSGAALEAAPGEQIPVLGTTFAVRFSAGPTDYELNGSRSGSTLRLDDQGDVLGTETIDFGAVPLSPEQHLLIVVMFDSRQRLGAIEANTVLAARLGWSIKKFNRKLDAVCDKLSRLGVPGMKGSNDRQADNRRNNLVSYAVTAELVGPHDLALLRATDGSRAAEAEQDSDQAS